MILGLIFVGITLAVLGLLLLPIFLKQGAAAQRVDYDIVVYRDQLAEVDKDIERGFLTDAQAEAAKAEIYRRMLEAEDAEAAVSAGTAEGGSSTRSKDFLALVLLIVLPLGAGIVYAHLGSPVLAGKPYKDRMHDPDFTTAKEAEQLAAELEKKPDADGFKHLADSYSVLRRYDDAVTAYRQAIKMNGGNAALWSELGEALALSHEDLVVPEAHKAFIQALRLDSHDARARFYLGLSETQIGELRRAVAIWRDLEQDSPPDAPWLAMVKEHIATFAKDGGFDPQSIPPKPPSLTSPHDGAMGIKPKKPADKDSDIPAMVERLAVKLKQNPDDLDGWLRLAKSYRVLGETSKAEEAAGKAEALKAKINHSTEEKR